MRLRGAPREAFSDGLIPTGKTVRAAKTHKGERKKHDGGGSLDEGPLFGVSRDSRRAETGRNLGKKKIE